MDYYGNKLGDDIMGAFIHAARELGEFARAGGEIRESLRFTRSRNSQPS